jgi:WD40 repeat protein
VKTNRFLICRVLFLSASLALHAQSGIELPKPNTGPLGVHFKLVQSIPYESRVLRVPKFVLGEKVILVPSSAMRTDKHDNTKVGSDLDVYSLISGNKIGTYGFLDGYCFACQDATLAATTERSKRGLDVAFYRLGGDQPQLIARAQNVPEGLTPESARWGVFSLDGAYFAEVIEQNQVVVWDIRMGKRLATLKTVDAIAHIGFSMDSRSLFAAAEDRAVTLWNIPSGAQVRHWELGNEGEGKLLWATVIPSRNALVSAAGLISEGPIRDMWDVNISMWDISSSNRIRSFHLDRVDIPMSFDVSPDGSLLVLAQEREVRVLNLATGTLEALPNARESARNDCSFSPSGTYVECAGDDERDNRILRVWRIERE